MKTFQNVIVLAACILSVYAVPKIQPRTLFANSVESGESNSIAADETACANKYTQSQQYTNQQVSIQTKACLQNNINTDPSNPQTLAQVSVVRSNLTTLQSNVANCLSMTDNLDFVTCVANYNDANQHLLNNANENAQNAEGQLNNQVNPGNQKNCVSHVLGHAKTNLTNAANAYNKCLETVLNNENSSL